MRNGLLLHGDRVGDGQREGRQVSERFEPLLLREQAILLLARRADEIAQTGSSLAGEAGEPLVEPLGETGSLSSWKAPYAPPYMERIRRAASPIKGPGTVDPFTLSGTHSGTLQWSSSVASSTHSYFPTSLSLSCHTCNSGAVSEGPRGALSRIQRDSQGRSHAHRPYP